MTSSGKILEISSGSAPTGFDWIVTSGTVEVTEQGYVDPANQVFAGSAYEGSQWLDLDGISPGTISQSFATTPGTLYALSFAYANNPFQNNSSDSGNPSATIHVVDTATMGQLATLSISHSTSTADDFNWTLSGPLVFAASGVSSTLVFASNDAAASDQGIFLDAIAVNSVPEPSSLAMLLIGAVAAVGVASCRQRPTPNAANRLTALTAPFK